MSAMLNIAVIGCGYWGPNHIRNFSALSNCTVPLVCDRNEERLQHIKSLYKNIATTTDHEQVIRNDEIDAVVIATPTNTHYSLAKQCLEAGKHVLIEKPMASSVAEGKELLEIAEKKSRTVMVGHTFVYSAPVRKIKEIIDSGALGELLYINSQRLNLGLFQKDINVAWDLAPHDISIIHYLLDEDPITVNCQGKAHITQDIEDVTNISLQFSKSAFAMIQSSWINPNKIRTMIIVGSKKMIIYDDTEPLEKIKVYDKRVELPPHYDTFADFQYSYHYGDMHCPHIKHKEPLQMEAADFVKSIETGAPPEASGLEGLKVLAVLEAASESLKKGGAKIAIHNYETTAVSL